MNLFLRSPMPNGLTRFRSDLPDQRRPEGWNGRVYRIERGNISGRTVCALGDAAAMPVQSFVKHFRDEFQYHIEHKTCLVPKDVQWAGSGFHRVAS
jgi:hypothetical protein